MVPSHGPTLHGSRFFGTADLRRDPLAVRKATAAYALVSEWWHRYRSRLELASYSHEQRKDLGFSVVAHFEIMIAWQYRLEHPRTVNRED
jgi:uncharacterized protein YjiS (DUF1127 family)